MGFLPEALVNYLGRMGWSMPDEREKFTLTEMEQVFDIQRVSLGGPIFDVEKLNWLNGLWIREDLTTAQLGQRLQDWALNADMLEKILPHAQSRMNILSDFIPLSAYLVSGALPLPPKILTVPIATSMPLCGACSLFYGPSKPSKTGAETRCSQR